MIQLIRILFSGTPISGTPISGTPVSGRSAGGAVANIRAMMTDPAVSRIAKVVLLLLSLSTELHRASAQQIDCVQIERVLPPVGIEIDAVDRTRWLAELDEIDSADLPATAATDVQVLTKAVRLAIEFRELYQPNDRTKVDRLLRLARERMKEIQTGSANWHTEGRHVRGFRSAVDGSVQPLGIIIPEEVSGPRKNNANLPLYVWLHGRGDKATDLHFICERLDKDGEVKPPGAIVLHPFGRQCIGYKSAGETDVLEAIDFVCQNYPIDERRIVLIGFSMGGAGVWHLAAHYPDRFVAASPGAGFAETARYQNLKPENFPPIYEQKLWSIYDVPGYTRNLFNLPFIAYSGELDKQIQAARVMEEAFQAEGRTLPHLIGPGMGHKYHPDTLKELLGKLGEAASAGQPVAPKQLWLQSKHPRYNHRSWITIDGVREQYADTRVDAKLLDRTWQLETRNATRIELDLSKLNAPREKLLIDNQALSIQPGAKLLRVSLVQDRWNLVEDWPSLRKRPQQSGPIDDAFIDPFLVVVPSGKAGHVQVERWVTCEFENFRDRWKGLFRGEPRVKLDRDVTAEDLRDFHLVVWGDPQSNSILRRAIEAKKNPLPFAWSRSTLEFGKQPFAPESHVPVMVYPNPLANDRYIVINSGPTFRQAHDRTNSLQNPHLPDWSIISLEQPPSATSPGRVVKAGFFDDSWQFDNKLTW